MDNPTPEPSTNELDAASAGSLIGALMDPEKPDDKDGDPPVDTEIAIDVEASPADPEMVEVDIDGYKVSLPKDKADKLNAERLMQADYTKKTMATADERKAATAQQQKAMQERSDYASNLQRMQAQLEGAMQEQSKSVDFEALLQNDPVEYLRQQHLAQTRQAALQANYAEQQKIAAQMQAERDEFQTRHLAQQQEELLAKLPEWRDEKKATAERVAIRDYLLGQGFEAADLAQVTDARSVVMARKAMLYDQMVSKAQAAAKKVSTLPNKVERPGGGESQSIDKRAAAYQRLSKSGRIDDAAGLIASIL